MEEGVHKLEQRINGDLLTITPLGAGNEVGRSCILLEFKNKKILFDCGVHPAESGRNALPFFDIIEPDRIDIVCITHFHLDHVGALPFFVEKTTFKGGIYMTHPTRAISKHVLMDSTKIGTITTADDMLFREKDIHNCMGKVNVVDYEQEITVSGMKLSCYNAGHVLGAAMFLINIDGVKILYTGDYSREQDRHLKPANFPGVGVDLLIVESTYGMQINLPRPMREANFTKSVHKIVDRGGRCLLPVFATGRVQELLLILEEYWDKHPELNTIPIYFASSLGSEVTDISKKYINMMGTVVRKKFEAGVNPFKFQHITRLKKLDSFDDVGACVVVASPGMLQSGPSRELFEKWCSSHLNGVVFTGYAVKKTLAMDIMKLSQGMTHTLPNKKVLKINLSIDSTTSFSAHCDYAQTAQFIDKIKPPNIILVHGDVHQMSNLKNKLDETYSENCKVFMPKNTQRIQLEFRTELKAKIVGNLAKEIIKRIENIPMAMSDSPTEEEKIEDNYIPLSGVVIKDGFDLMVMGEEDLTKYTNLEECELKQKLYIPYKQDLIFIKGLIQELFRDIEIMGEENTSNLKVVLNGEISVSYNVDTQNILLEWVSTSNTDLAVDSLILGITQIPQNPQLLYKNLLENNSPLQDSYQEKYFSILYEILNHKFNVTSNQNEKDMISLVSNNYSASLQLLNGYNVESESEDLKKDLEAICSSIQESLQPAFRP